MVPQFRWWTLTRASLWPVAGGGIDAEELSRHLREGGHIEGFKGEGVEHVSATDLLETECEVFIPAALGG